MHGLTVRWSLEATPPEVMERLREYVEGPSYARFSGLKGLRFKTWRAREGEWFEGCYVFASHEERESFQAEFEAGATDSPVSKIIEAAPMLIEPCEVVAVAEGAEGFLAAPSYLPESG